MPITFDRTLCCNLDETIAREWLITNGLGGYAAGTVAGTLTRMQQGLLVAALDEEAVPQLLMAKIDEEVLFDQRTYYLGTNEYRDGTLNPAGFVHLEAFRLEEGLPIFTYRLGGVEGVMLEKRIWMHQGQNTTFIQYRVLRTQTTQTNSASPAAIWRSTGRSGYNGYARSYTHGDAGLTLTLLPFVAHRPYNQRHQGQGEGYFQVHTHQQQAGQLADDDDSTLTLPHGCAGCTINTWDKKTPYHLLAIGHPESQAQFIPTGVWYWNFQHRRDQAAGLAADGDLYLPGVVRARLWPDKDSSLTIVVTTEDVSSLPFSQKQVYQTYEQALDYQRSFLQSQSYFGDGGGSVQTLPVLPLASAAPDMVQSAEFLQLLCQAGDHLLIQRTLPYQDRAGKSAFFFRAAEHIPIITPDYYEQEDDVRATLIALPGLTVTTHRYSEAQRILRYLGRYFRQGLLPNRLPTAQRPRLTDEDYANVDIALWYFYALDKYLDATHDYELLDELYLRLVESSNWYTQGTSYGIQVDPRDGLLRTGTSGQALTWMNALAQGKAVTPRAGKAVEVNALWYHALSLLHEWSQLLYQRGRINYGRQQYVEQIELCRRSFNERFWCQHKGYLYDVIDGPEGNDERLRPNQLLASSLRYAVLAADKQEKMLDIITQQLLTPCGLRSLTPFDPAYQGQLPELRTELPYALHQGSAWPWLIGPYIDALLKVDNTLPHVSTSGTGRDGQPGFYQEYIWRKGLQALEPFRQQMLKHMLGNISDVYDGDTPHTTGPHLASALSVGEILRIYSVLAHMGVQHSDQALSV
ncbi:MAG TPA: amylo-alpha-1,6-glucosidase [Ktedonobacteraceae bacterium]